MQNPILNPFGLPRKHGLYDPAQEKDSCGVGFVAHIKGERSHQIVLDADEVLRNMDHRGACGCEANTGDGSGI
jgi:glutamate synthase (NADPH/NADH) large chain